MIEARVLPYLKVSSCILYAPNLFFLSCFFYSASVFKSCKIPEKVEQLRFYKKVKFCLEVPLISAMPLIIFPLNIVFISFLFSETFFRISNLRMGQVWEVIGYRKMRYFNGYTAFHSFESRILPVRSTSMRILYSICCVVWEGRRWLLVMEGEASDEEFLWVKSRWICRLSKTWPSKATWGFSSSIFICQFWNIFLPMCKGQKNNVNLYAFCISVFSC